jgi:hypothetical protein
VNEQTPVGGPVDADSGYGTVLVRNDSDFENCVVIGGDSQGRVWKGSSEGYDVALGSHKVEAWVGDEVAPPRQAPDSRGMRQELQGLHGVSWGWRWSGMSLWKRFLLVVSLLCLASSAWADPVHFRNVAWSGVYQGVVPGGLVLRTPWGTALLPQGISLTVGGNRVDLSSLAVGTSVFVQVPDGSGQVVGGYGDTVFVQYPFGVVPVPGSVLGDAGGRAKVTVLKRNGSTVRVPLNAALNMQRAQGATILGASPVGGWPVGGSGPTIILGSQGESLLLQAVINGTTRLYRVPRSRAGTLVQVPPGTLVEVRPQGNSLGWGPWHNPGQGPGHNSAPGRGQGRGQDKGQDGGRGR